MTTGKPPLTGHRELPGSPGLTRRGPRLALAVALAVSALSAMSGCASESKSFAPPPGSLTADRAIGDIMVRFTPPPVIVSEDAGRLLAEIKGPVRYEVKRPMSGGIWLVTAITSASDITLAQALSTLRAAPRIETAEPDRIIKPHHDRPTGRDMPPD